MKLIRSLILFGSLPITRYGYDADVKCGSKIVDAKSIVGVLSLARSKALELIVHSDECDALLEEIAQFAA